MVNGKAISPLGYALLGVLQGQPQSGYDLRKLFATTPLKSYSDSPGSIYPALARLEKAKLIRGRIEPSAGMRRRRLYSLTGDGLSELRRWQALPITKEDIQSRVDDVMLRFSFNDQLRGPEQALEFLRTFEAAVDEYTEELKQFYKAAAPAMNLSGRLALESGIQQYETLLAWARSSSRSYQRELKKG